MQAISVDSQTLIVKSTDEEDLSEIIRFINQREKQKNMTKLREYSQLQNNWNLEGAKSFSKKLIDLAWDKINELEIQPEVFPTMRESIQFEYEKENGDYLEFEIYEDKIETFEIINGEEVEHIFATSKNLNEIANIKNNSDLLYVHKK